MSWDFGTEGWGFESLRVHWPKTPATEAIFAYPDRFRVRYSKRRFVD